MSSVAKRGAAAAGTVAVASAVNVATGMLTQKWDLAWWGAVAVLVVLGGGLQAWLTVAGTSPQPGVARQRVHGTRVGGSVRQSLQGAGEQSVSDSEVGGGLQQNQRRPSADGG